VQNPSELEVRIVSCCDDDRNRGRNEVFREGGNKKPAPVLELGMERAVNIQKTE